MATRAERLIEANKRGLLSGEKKARFDEAVSRGLITLPSEQQTDESLSPAQVAEPPSQFQQAALQSSVIYPSEKTSTGAFLQGAKRGFQNLGFGILQRGSEVADFLGFDADEFQSKIKLIEDIEKQKYKQTAEERPIASTAGEIAGSIASFPVAPEGALAAVGAGAVYGLLQSAESKGDIAKNIIQESIFGGLGAVAAPYIQKGFNKSQAMFASIYKKATGADPRPEMFMPDGSLSDSGKSAIEKLGITQEDFAGIYENLDEALNPIAAGRVELAKEFGVDLTTAQATKDFAQQEAEQTLKASVTREGTGARAAEEAQQRQLEEAQTGFVQSLSPVADKEARGEVVQQTLRDLRTEGSENVSQLYKDAAEIPGASVPLEKENLLDVIDDVFLRPVDDKVVTSTESLLAKFGLIGGEPEQVGRFYQVAEESGKPIKFRGEQTPLTLENAEEFRKGLNQIFPADQSGAINQIIKEVDDQVGRAVESLPSGSERTAAFQQARAAAREQKEIFNQKDIVQKLVDFKKGTKTDQLAPDRVIDSIIKGNNSLADIRRIKGILMKNPTEKTEGAWKSIQAQSVADLFGKSINPPTGEISGQRLSTAIKAFGSGSVELTGRKKTKDYSWR